MYGRYLAARCENNLSPAMPSRNYVRNCGVIDIKDTALKKRFIAIKPPNPANLENLGNPAPDSTAWRGTGPRPTVWKMLFPLLNGPQRR